MSWERDKKNGSWVVKVGLASCGIAAGGQKVYDSLKASLNAHGLKNVELRRTGCMGLCYSEALVEVFPPQGRRVFYRNVTPEQIQRIVEEHIIGGEACRRMGYTC